MSDVLMEFLEPYTQFARTDDEMEKLLPLAVVAWNASLLDSQKCQQMLEAIINVTPPSAKADLKSILEQMMKRRQKHFSQNRRMVLEYQLTRTPQGPHLAVVSTMPNADEFDEM